VLCKKELCVQRTLPFGKLSLQRLLPFALKNQMFAFGFAFCNILKIYIYLGWSRPLLGVA
jgi:hypothetical protein